MLYDLDSSGNYTVLNPRPLKEDIRSNISDEVYKDIIYPMIPEVVKLRAGGYTLDGVANFLGITTHQMSACIDKYPEFREAIERGANLLKANLTTTLYQRGRGFVHETKKTVTEKRGDVILSEKTEVSSKLVYSDACLFRALEIVDPENHRRDEHKEITTEDLIKRVRNLSDKDLAEFINQLAGSNE